VLIGFTPVSCLLHIHSEVLFSVIKFRGVFCVSRKGNVCLIDRSVVQIFGLCGKKTDEFELIT
jgi:hypothetical protein